MKTVAFFVCVLVGCLLVSGAPNLNIKEVHRECQSNSATHLDDEVLKAIHKDEPFDRALVGAHMLCMSTKMGIQNEDGTINREGLKNALATTVPDKAQLEALLDKCAVEGPSPGETALKLTKCVRENTPRESHHGHHH